MVDHRLEAVAGEPLHVVTEPTRVSNYPGGTILAVGRYVYAPENTLSRQMLMQWNAIGGYLYVRNEAPSWLAGSDSLASQRGTVGEIWWGYTDAAETTSVGFGTPRGPVEDLDWRSSILGVAYNRTLNDAEAMRVIRWMIPRLG